MRAAEINRFAALDVLRMVCGRVSRPPGTQDIERLANICGCSVSDAAELFGFDGLTHEGMRYWRLGNEWITKSYFISSRMPAVCPACLRTNDPWIPGTWELTLYRACAVHRVAMLTVCPACRRSLRWCRARMWRCECGFDLRQSDTSPASDVTWTLSQLIAKKLDPSVRLAIPLAVKSEMVEQLVMLSLDGMFKTIWFLGHRLGDFERCTIGHGRKKAKAGFGEEMIERTFSMLNTWPYSMAERVTDLLRKALNTHATNIYARAFKPLSLYIDENMSSPELNFLRLAYERHIRELWRTLGNRKLPAEFGHQQEFEL